MAGRFLSGITDTARVVALARAIRENAGGVPVIYTRRSTLAVGEQASALGQVPIEDLRTVLEILQRALAPG